MRQPRWVVVATVCAISSAAMAQDHQSKIEKLLGGAPSGAAMTFPTPPKTRIYGSTEDIRWMSEVEAMLEVKAQLKPPPAGKQARAKLALCFKVDALGRPFGERLCGTTGNRPLEGFARHVLATAGPFPPPPASEVNRELSWVYAYGHERLQFR